eukprot:TRINITY_DN10682_c0_g1_i1.p1 TRINITY_DN10682_c0_g1~~TRINITY_DN10682_c0_g1_i1.p1  ORF type:complete len:353 (-),score=107.12 TRINITY_DN10682_c0_g1_i1:28-1086(-)
MTDFVGGAHEEMRIRKMTKDREDQQRMLEEKKRKLKEDMRKGVQKIDSKFAAAEVSVEERLKTETVGLKSFDEFKKQRELLQAEEEHNRLLALKEAEAKKQIKKTTDRKKLSFSMDDEEEENGEAEEEASDKKEAADNANNSPGEENKDKNDDEDDFYSRIKKRKIMKNPQVDTTFLPDRDRELKEAEERARLAREWMEEQERIKAESIEVTFSYWDGTGHRRTLTCTKGVSIGKFLEMVRNEFKELRSVSVDNLLFIKEDLIIPQHISFYDLIVTKARGKSGPLFNWDVHDDIRLINDATKEKDESHAAKVVERRWYERNKHIFPASRWEVYDPSVQREKYTISDKSKKKE